MNNPLPIKFSKEVSDFIERYGSYDEENYYWLPHYYKKVGEGLYEIVLFKDLPSGLKHIVEQSEPRSEEEFNNTK